MSLAAPHFIWDLSFVTRDRTHAHKTQNHSHWTTWGVPKAKLEGKKEKKEGGRGKGRQAKAGYLGKVLFATPWTVAHQASLPMELSRQEYWSGLPFPSPGDLPTN